MIKNINFRVTEEEHETLRLWCLNQKKSLRTLFKEYMIDKARNEVRQ